MSEQTLAVLKRGIEEDDVAGVTEFLDVNASTLELLKADACSAFCSSLPPVLARVRSPGMADVLLRHRLLTPAMVTEWWASGFGLDRVSPLVAEHLIQSGAVVTPHAAAAIGLKERLREMLDLQPSLVHAKGGDGARPLHFSRDVETARLLLDRGAQLDPQDEDHASTPAQWRIRDSPEVTRFLIRQGAATDVFMAAGLGDLELAKDRVSENPTCVTYRIGNNSGPFPGIGFQGRGGTIYQWTLGFNQSPHEVAHHRGHTAVFDFLMDRTPPRYRFLVACMLADRPQAESIAARHPGVRDELDDEDRALLAKSCWETNLDRDAVRLMLDLGFPVDFPEFSHGFLPLHNAAWCGDPELVQLLLERGHPVDRRDPNHQSTALGFALHSCLVAKRHPEGDFPCVVELLLAAGVPLDEKHYPTGNAEIDAVIEARRTR